VATGSGGNTLGYSNDGSVWTASQTISPNQFGLTSNTWTQSGVTWTASVSRTLDSNSYPAYGAFNNYTGSTFVYSWASPAYYSSLTGLYTLGPATTPVATTTTVQAGIGSLSGEWLQIQSSVPLVLNSYRYGCGGYGNFPQSYYIVGSSDGTTWFPIQRCVMSTNPLTTNFTVCSTNIIVNQSGTQTIIGGQTGSGTFTTYSPYTTTAYTHYRLIGMALWSVGTGGNMEANEWYLHFNGATIFSTAGSGVASNNSLPGTVTIQHPVIAVGSGTNSLAYSPDGVQWTGLGTNIFSTGNGVAWNGSKWIACGTGNHTLAHSIDGLRWTGMGTNVFSNQAYDIAWNGSIWVAVGSGTNSIAYSTDSITWAGSTSGNSIFTTRANGVAWSGTQWVAVGQGTNSIAYSSDGITWTAVSATIFSTQGNHVAWTGALWVAVGAGTNTIAHSSDGITWTPVTSSPFTTSGNGICWNGSRWVAVGSGTNTLAYSANGTTWTGFGTNLFSVSGNGVCWTGTRFVAVGSGSNPIIYSSDGLTWNIVAPVTPSFYLPFDGSVVDVLGNSAPVATGSVSYVTGYVGPQAINIVNTAGGTASQYVQMSIPNMNAFTVSFWFTIQSYQTSSAQMLFSSGSGGWKIYIDPVTFVIGYNLPLQAIKTTVSVSLNTWYHITAIYQLNSTCSIYVNKILSGSITNNGNNGLTMTTIRLGAQDSTTGEAFNGYIDDFRLYNFAVSNIDLTTPIFTQGNGVAGNPRIGATICDSQIVLSSGALDVASDSYYNTGYTEMSATIQSQTLT
jgi:hypothetical protein